MGQKRLPEWVKFYQPKFEKLFGFKMPYDFTGIDVIKLDDMIAVPDGTSTNDFITTKWGKEASELVSEMIHDSPSFANWI